MCKCYESMLLLLLLYCCYCCCLPRLSTDTTPSEPARLVLLLTFYPSLPSFYHPLPALKKVMSGATA